MAQPCGHPRGKPNHGDKQVQEYEIDEDRIEIAWVLHEPAGEEGMITFVPNGVSISWSGGSEQDNQRLGE